MKIVCDCGNTMEFIQDDAVALSMEDDERGVYCDKDNNKFNIWSEHDEAGVICMKCNLAIWYFS